MSERYKFVEGHAHFITFAVVGWVDVFTRREYAEFLLQNLAYCRKNKGLRLYTRNMQQDDYCDRETLCHSAFHTFSFLTGSMAPLSSRKCLWPCVSGSRYVP